MYLLVSLTDVVQIHPTDFNKPGYRAIEDFINAKYADKVIHKVGLCVAFHSIISTSEGLIGHGTGIVNVNVDFRLIVFRPFKGEIVSAIITNAAPQVGIVLSHDFFEDVVVPPETLFQDTRWDRDENGTELFIWYQKAADYDEPTPYYFDRAEKCLYRVEEEQWTDLSPQKQKPHSQFADQGDDLEGRRPPYLIRGSMMLSGLGPTLWWSTDEIDGPDDDVDGDVDMDAQP
ncbi:RNA polymerase III subunit Rpc25-domain-containing protein [Neohortaea acidophila]|uniref:DNA-directed RNA polymerase subunit n=1 Tax=Neohortaea acidophila TaxID=245834 RepID=A0A6A6PPE4_9PEZI|nr:RNA polymerase III subunit Rpc25-domain-containing protein [Neohortaea acidophila]KAF2481127.1 RNA polymerase III subunit Rpc25-domain-containing protein [Neohortaea acidophila]